MENELMHFFFNRETLQDMHFIIKEFYLMRYYLNTHLA